MKKRVVRFVLLFVLVTGCQTVPTVPKDARSAHFEETAQHLHMGGSVFTYVDVDGDLAMASRLLDDVAASIEEIPFETKTKINVTKWAQMLGLDRIDAIGMSSYAVGDRFVNRAFIHHTGARVGALNVGGGDPHPFEVISLAPSDSAMVFETDVNFKALTDVFFKIIKESLDEDEVAGSLSKMTEPLGPSDITMKKLVEQLDTKVMGILRVDNERQIQIPETETKIPVVDLVLVIDNWGVLFDSAVRLFGESPLFFHDSRKEFETLEFQFPLPEEFKEYHPIIRKDKKSGRVYIASRPAYLQECLSTENPIQNKNDFMNATKGLPVEAGNGLSYTSPQFAKTLQEVLEAVLKNDEDIQWTIPLIKKWYPTENVGQAGVRVNHSNGTLYASNASHSHKMTLLTAMVVNPVSIGVMAALAIPAFKKYKEKASLKKDSSSAEEREDSVLDQQDVSD